MEFSAQSDSQAHLQIMGILNVFTVVLFNLHLHWMEGNSPGPFCSLWTASVQGDLFKDVCMANRYKVEVVSSPRAESKCIS